MTISHNHIYKTFRNPPSSCSCPCSCSCSSTCLCLDLAETPDTTRQTATSKPNILLVVCLLLLQAQVPPCQTFVVCFSLTVLVSGAQLTQWELSAEGRVHQAAVDWCSGGCGGGGAAGHMWCTGCSDKHTASPEIEDRKG